MRSAARAGPANDRGKGQAGRQDPAIPGEDPADKAAGELAADWPKWQIWVVDRVVGGPLFCARRWDGTGHNLNGDSAAELAEKLEAEVTDE